MIEIFRLELLESICYGNTMAFLINVMNDNVYIYV